LSQGTSYYLQGTKS